MYRSNNGFIRSLFLEGEGDPSGGAPAPAAETYQIQHGDQTIELPAAALKPILEKQIADKYIPKASHNDQMSRMRKELDTYKGRPDADTLLNDPDFKSKAVQAWGFDPKAAKAEIAEQRTRLLAELNEREIKPRDAKLTQAMTEVQKLRYKDLHGQIAQAASSVKVDEKFTRVPGKNAKSFIASMMENGFEYDEEHGEWFAKGSAGNKFQFSQTGDVPYMTVSEYFQVWANGEGKDFLRSERQPGAEANPDGQRGGPVAGQVGKELRLTSEQIRDIGFFKKMVDKAQREGLTIVPV
jgi:hypothetical protein